MQMQNPRSSLFVISITSRSSPSSCALIDDRFRASELTFRHLKTHLANKLGMTYEQLQADEYSSVVEDTTDQIANECHMGEVPLEDCKKRIGYADEEEQEREEL